MIQSYPASKPSEEQERKTQTKHEMYPNTKQIKRRRKEGRKKNKKGYNILYFDSSQELSGERNVKSRDKIPALTKASGIPLHRFVLTNQVQKEVKISLAQ